MSGSGSDDTFLASVFDVRNDVKLDAVSPAISAFAVVVTGTEQDSSLSPQLEDESISK